MLKSIITIAVVGLIFGGILEYILRKIEPEEFKTARFSGAISNDPDYINKFAKAEKDLKDTFDGKVINPVREIQLEFKDPGNEKWQTLMLSCLKCLSDCTHIYMLRGWTESAGARIEKAWAEKLNIQIIHEHPRKKIDFYV